MPQIREAPPVQELDLTQQELITSLQEMKEVYALNLVRQTFFHYETFRQQNHDTRWQTNDALYLGYVPARTWEGTTIPRASLSWPIVFDQVETMLPAIMQAIFGNQPEWFQIEADSAGNIQAAREAKAHLLYNFEHNNDAFGLNVTNDIELAVKSLLMYGNGGLALEWDFTKNRPVVSWVDNRDIYFDPGSTIPAVDYCRSVVRRSMKTVDEILAWSGTPGIKLPDKEVLWGMAQAKQYAAGDQNRQIQAALMGYTQTSGHDEVIPLPADRHIEVLTYYSKDRIIVALNREWCAFVQTNPYGFIPLVFSPCYIVPGKTYAMSIADVQEGNQRYAEALLNARLDEVHLALHPPRVQKASSILTPNQQKWAPGRVFKVADPKNDFVALTPGGATTNVYEEISLIQQMAEKRTGANSLGQGGLPTPSNANRTGMGMQMQLQGSASRLHMIVKHIEDYMLVPLLYKLYKMIQLHNNKPGFVPGRSEDGQVQQVNVASFQKPVQFKIRASSQMLTRDKLAQIFPFLLQYLTSGPFMQGLAQTGLTIDWTELLQMLQDATGISKSYNLVRPMNEQEQQKLNQPSPDAQAEQQKSQMEAQLRMQIAQMSTQTDLQKAMIQKQPDPQEQQAAQQKLEMDMMREQVKLQVEQQKLELAREQAAMQLQMKRMEMQLKMQEAQMKAIIGQQEAEQGFTLKTQQAQLDSTLSQEQHTLAMEQARENAKVQAKQRLMKMEQAK